MLIAPTKSATCKQNKQHFVIQYRQYIQLIIINPTIYLPHRYAPVSCNKFSLTTCRFHEWISLQNWIQSVLDASIRKEFSFLQKNEQFSGLPKQYIGQRLVTRYHQKYYQTGFTHTLAKTMSYCVSERSLPIAHRLKSISRVHWPRYRWWIATCVHDLYFWIIWMLLVAMSCSSHSQYLLDRGVFVSLYECTFFVRVPVGDSIFKSECNVYCMLWKLYMCIIAKHSFQREKVLACFFLWYQCSSESGI